MTQTSQAVEGAAIAAIPNFRRQDDYLLAGGASIMSENCHEIIHVDTLRKIIAAVRAELARPLEVALVGDADILAINNGDKYFSTYESIYGRETNPHTQPPTPQDAAPAVAGEAWRHIANERADMATNGIQYIKNIRDGITTCDEALKGLAGDLEHCRSVQRPATPSGVQPTNEGEKNV